MIKYQCENCPETMNAPLYTLINNEREEFHFCSLKCLKEYVEGEINKLSIKDERFEYGEDSI